VNKQTEGSLQNQNKKKLIQGLYSFRTLLRKHIPTPMQIWKRAGHPL